MTLQKKRKYCPECGTKTLEYNEGFTYPHHCTKCGYFFTIGRELCKPKIGVVLVD